jgi:hypothetical protein
MPRTGRIDAVLMRIAADYNWESKLDHAMKPLSLGTLFEHRDYGADLTALCVVVMCRSEDFKRRVRYARSEKVLYLDVMLTISDFVSASHAERRQRLAHALKNDVIAELEKRRFKQFDLAAFASDFISAIDEQLLGPEAERFDRFVLERATGF